MSDRTEILVVGAGVIGLTTALVLARAGHRVRIRTDRPPHRTTSAAAGAVIGPVPDPDPQLQTWLEYSDPVFRALAQDSSTGVRIADGRIAEPGLPEWVGTIPGYAPCPETPGGISDLIRVRLPVVDMQRYLRWLTAELDALGVPVVVDPVPDLSAARDLAPVVVNCTGAAAARWAGDPSVRPVRGRQVVVRNPGLTDFFYQGGPVGSSWVNWFAHGDRVLVGGCAEPDTWDDSPDPAAVAPLLARAAQVEPRLADAEVLDLLTGLRPFRPTVRIEAENLGGTRVVHHYGHGANGVMLSWATAREAAELVSG